MTRFGRPWLLLLLLWTTAQAFLFHHHRHRRPLTFLQSTVLDDYENRPLTASQLQSLTVVQLQQQLRLRGLPVKGRKQELIDRLVRGSVVIETTTTDDNEQPEFVNVSEYLEDDDANATFRSIPLKAPNPDDDDDPNPVSNDPEVWGSQARMVENYEGRSVVVDNLSRTLVEFVGSNQTMVQAYVVASREALKPSLERNRTTTPAEDRLRQLQLQREQANRRPMSLDDQAGLDEGDENGLYANVLQRDYSDWGKYTATGAQLSAQEVEGVLLLPDVYGLHSDDVKALAEKIAFECQPVVVLVPDLFRGNPWKDDSPVDYETWRNQVHDDVRVSVDIRAAASCLREQYQVSSVVVWGLCYGGGRALEAAAGYLPSVHDVNGAVGPPPVDPNVAIAWYPTRYQAPESLFGANHLQGSSDESGKPRTLAVMSIFAEQDTLPGATKEDAATLKRLLEEDARVKDHMVKVFPGQDHGFAHNGLATPGEADELERFVDQEFGGAGRVALADGDAEVACLLSTAFMETYSRVFLPTVGPPISIEEEQWGTSIEMEALGEPRDVRQEIEDSLDSFVDEPMAGRYFDPNDPSQEEQLRQVLMSMENDDMKQGPYAIEADDNIETVYAKLKAVDEDFQLF